MNETATVFRAGFGVDGARAGWVVASGGGRHPELTLVSDLAILADEIAHHGALVDIPVGLPGGDHPTRTCDREARRLLGPRRSSVFPAPSRAALAASGWAEANRVNRDATGRGLPRQSWGLVPKIREVDRVLVDGERLRGRLRESHPELAFTWLNGGTPMPAPKKDAEGLAERWMSLEAVWAGVESHATRWAARHAGIAPDDVADALALLALGGAGALPLPSRPQLDEEGLPMEILAHPSLIPGASPKRDG
ncbi:MAG TPA: DUF429 domain-containing protein [Longimicrobiales bacterium]|nr:DUF429 domain-containing protein [Longimicrobiales bacterium]